MELVQGLPPHVVAWQKRGRLLYVSLGISRPEVKMFSGLDSAKFCDQNLDVVRSLKPRYRDPSGPGLQLESKMGLLWLAIFRRVWVPGAARVSFRGSKRRRASSGSKKYCRRVGSGEPSLRSRAGQAPARAGLELEETARALGRLGSQVLEGLPGPVLTLLFGSALHAHP